ncbi:PIN domain-containing protein [Promineifilum sp.]|uniref:PIN domain-containing protein n=1 Tax=Promineifilum sp. TaxID=2664178 RepID=UPI0035ADB1E7
MLPALIDTNLLVYLFDPSDKQKQTRAGDLLNELYLLQAGYLSVQCLAEFFHVTTRGSQPLLTPAKALQQVEHFQSAYSVFPLTAPIVLEAGRGVRDHQLAYYDAQIWATAHLNQIPLVLSEDFQTGRIVEGVRFINPLIKDFQLSDWL